MSESGDSGPGLREVAHRVFAAEFDDAEFSYSESDEERAPNYVVTPTGARANRLFAVGVLTELEQVNDEVLRARVVDPTGAFVVYAGQYQPEALAFLEGATPPLFVAVTGKARTFEPEDGDRVFTSIRPEAISEVNAETRDRWVVQAAEQTVARVDRLASARQSGLSGDALKQALVAAGVSESDADGAALALEYYDTTGDYLQAVRELALNAARVVAGERDEAGTLSRDPGDGTDDPLASLVTMDLEAPAETASVAPSDEPATGGDEPASTADVADEGNEETLGDTTGADGTTDDDVGDFDTEFELDEDEREEIEAEYGTDFQSGTEVDDAGEADIETPDPEEVAEADAPPAEDVDLEDAVMDVMTDLNDGSGADREAVITEVMDTYGADRAAVEESIQDALMGGRCYEPDDDKLTPI
ncbi:hypothetical protein BRC96_00825 [Halobacteriales archaeon QS_6_64_34]|nr:MAG: hypothetical protein BRC96_00825 [Halobacteriales archaeon QS_6_64_34]